MPPRSSFVVVANRLPVDAETQPDGTVRWHRSPGGLVTALSPVMKSQRGIWVGWSGTAGEGPEPFTEDGIGMRAVPLSAREITDYYDGFCNGTLWPLYHDVVAPPEFHRVWWDSYVAINRRFADAAAEAAAPGAVVWVQDYQLQLVPQLLRDRRPDLRIGFFLHIPFPPQELFMQLPWRTQIVEGLLGADLVGFQLPGGAANFLRLTRGLLGLRPRGAEVAWKERTVHAGAFPISIDTASIDALAREDGIAKRAAQIRSELGNPSRVLLGVDRLDYTKGIGSRLKAFHELLDDGSVSVPDTVMVQVATPSRERVEHYKDLREQIERDVGRVNGEHGKVGVPAVHYLHHSYSREELTALFQAADVMLVTPLRDGMNLVAKEYVASRVDQGGALVLSEFAGAAAELRQAYLVNPHDIDGLKSTMLQALDADPAEARQRMRRMRRHVAEHDVTFWARAFLDALAAHS
ncbi:MAG TPA: trehalose-6-phosphate synthase [Cryptosporangiaceae bacterium]|nr:trehalose-6-phosphate synthase [Cryptosporangiaceae bacterium]